MTTMRFILLDFLKLEIFQLLISSDNMLKEILEVPSESIRMLKARSLLQIHGIHIAKVRRISLVTLHLMLKENRHALKENNHILKDMTL